MGKSGRRPRSSTYEKELPNRIQDIYVNSLPRVDQLVDQLRAKYPQYSRQKLQPFTRLVKQTLDSDDPTNKNNNKRNRKPVFEYTDDDDDVMQARKKTKKVGGRERNHVVMESGSGEEEEDGEESAVSMTGEEEDDDDRLKIEPEFDLMKSMLRNKYSKMDNAKRPGENVVELEVVTNNNSNKKEVVMIKEGSGDVIKAKGGKLGKERKSNKGGVGGDNNGGPRFKDLGGMKELLKELKKEVIVPFVRHDLQTNLGGRPTTGILLHGPPGCGKTILAQAIANEARVPFYNISATELVSGISGASEENIRDLFSKAYRTAPSIVFIDEIDAIASKRENLQRGMEQRIVTQLMTCMNGSYRVANKADGSSKNTKKSNGYVLVIGATNRPDALDPALRRPGRFDREISLGVPDENARVHILSVLANNMKLEGDFDLVKLSRETPGFVGADLSELMNKASNLAIKRIFDETDLELIKEGTDTEENEDWWRTAWTAEEKENHSITISDVEAATKLVQPSLKREGFSSIPDVKWEDVGGLDSLRKEFEFHIVRPIKDPDEYEEYGMDSETGFLLWGPPGCGKTLIAKAIANEAGANFIHIKGPELLNKYVGESELTVRTIFSRARRCSPCILFFDEVDALTTKRGMEEGGVAERVRKQLLIELDGGDQRKGVYVIGATNRPDVMDPAVLRPGRFGKHIYVPLPNEDERALILKALCKNKPLDDDVDLVAIAHSEACAGLSGADLKALVNEATIASIIERDGKIKAAKTAAAAREGTSVSSSLSPSGWGSMPRTINAVHFEQASRTISPSVSKKEKRFYDRLEKRFK